MKKPIKKKVTNDKRPVAKSQSKPTPSAGGKSPKGIGQTVKAGTSKSSGAKNKSVDQILRDRLGSANKSGSFKPSPVVGGKGSSNNSSKTGIHSAGRAAGDGKKAVKRLDIDTSKAKLLTTPENQDLFSLTSDSGGHTATGTDEKGNLMLLPKCPPVVTFEAWQKLESFPTPARPGPHVAVDFETYFTEDYSLTKMDLWAYITHPAFECYYVTFCLIDVNGDAWLWCGDPQKAPWQDIKDYEWVSHNARFDHAVYLRIRKEEWPVPTKWWCTMDLASYLQVPKSLNNMVKALFGVEIDKSAREKMKAGTITAAELQTYAGDDSIWCSALWCAFSAYWMETERYLSMQTRLIGYVGIYVDVEWNHNAMVRIADIKKEVEARIPWCPKEPIASKKALDKQCQITGIIPPPSLSMDDPLTVEWVLTHKKQNINWIEDISLFTKLVQTENFLQMLLDRRRENTGTVPFELAYCQAPHTRRWQSAGGLRLQNLDKDPVAGVSVRNALRPKPGHVFVVADSSQIEPRVLNWFVGDDVFLASCAAGQSPYEAHARATMGYVDPEPLKKKSPPLYALAKARLLALGYQAGAPKFVEMARTMCGLTLSEDEWTVQIGDNFLTYSAFERAWPDLEPEVQAKWNAQQLPVFPPGKQVVTEFRNASDKIVKFWYDCQDAMKQDIGRHHFVQLPTGRTIRYYNARLDEEGGLVADVVLDATRPVDKGKHFYGGKLVENRVQGASRDFLADKLEVIGKENILVKWHVHDEVICECPESKADGTLKMLTQIMSTPPAWAPNLPVACEASIEEFYTK